LQDITCTESLAECLVQRRMSGTEPVEDEYGIVTIEKSKVDGRAVGG
jgi:hypothetical protein